MLIAIVGIICFSAGFSAHAWWFNSTGSNEPFFPPEEDAADWYKSQRP